MTQQSTPSQKWYERIPHPVVMLFFIIVLAAILSYILPAGLYEREVVDGRQRVIPGTFKTITATPIGILDMFKAIPLGYKAAVEIIFVTLAGGIMFGVLQKDGTVENAVGTLVRKMGIKRRFFLVVMLTYLFGLLGVMIGYENNIAMVPIAAVVSLAIGGDLVLAAGISVGAITVGFGLSPINPYTVGTGHKIAELPMFSGALLRGTLCFVGLGILAYYNVRYFKKIIHSPEKSLGIGLNTSGFKLSKPIESYTIDRKHGIILGIFLLGIMVMLYGIFVHHWLFNEISALFLMIALACGLAAGMNGKDLSETAFESISLVAPGAFMIGYATSIKVILEMGNISDTIAHGLSTALTYFPTYASAIFMSIAQSIINFLIPSGSGQALATLPIMIPLGELLGLTRQTSILAYQIGDGITNLVNPTLGGLIAMLSLCRVPFDRWLRFILPLVGVILVIAWLFLLFSVFIKWGPF